MAAVRDVKDFLYSWCRKRKLTGPNYSRPKSSKQPKKTVQVKVDGNLLGNGEGTKLKSARTAAAFDLCEKLVAAGVMSESEFQTRIPEEKVSKVSKSPSKKNKNSNSGVIAPATIMSSSSKPLLLPTANSISPPVDPGRQEQQIDGALSVDKMVRPPISQSSNGQQQVLPPVAGVKRKACISSCSSNGCNNDSLVAVSSNKRSRPTLLPSPPEDPGHYPDNGQVVVGLNDPQKSLAGGSSSTQLEDGEVGDNDDDDVQIISPSKCFTNDAHHNNYDNRNIMKNSVEQKIKRDQLLRLLHDQIYAHYHRNKQPAAVYDRKMAALGRMESYLVSYVFPTAQLMITGSSMNGLGSYNCDMDVCLVIHGSGRQGQEMVDKSKEFAKAALKECEKAFRRGLAEWVSRIQFIPARVPILRFKYYYNRYSCVEVDINCNNLTGVRNTHLLHYYAAVDERFPALCLIVKHWALVNGINDASAGTLSSYALILLVIHYLQYGLTVAQYPPCKPLLPNLQALFPGIFNPNSDVRTLELFQTLPIPPELSPAHCPMNLAQLLTGFFNYYANYFDFSQWAPSIRTAGLIQNTKRSFVQCTNGKPFIGIEEPFERMNVARAVVKKVKFLKITSAFQEAYARLREDVSLEAIGVTLL